jgi:uncharacterized protein YraI
LGNANRWREIKKANGTTFTEAEARNLQVSQSIYLPVNQQVGTGTPVTPKPTPAPVKVQTKSGFVNSNVGSLPLNMRASASTGARILRTLRQGTQVTILRSLTGATYRTPNGATRSDWYEIQVNGQKGYVAGFYVTQGTPPPKAEPGFVNSNVGSVNLNMRSSASTSARVVRTLSRGTNLTILRSVTGASYKTPNGATRSDWYEVQVGNQKGYVAAYYVSKGTNNSPGGGNNSPITTQQQYLQRLYGGSPGTITQGYHANHRGLDSVHQGANPRRVYSLTSGVVRFIGKDHFGGNYVMIWNPQLQRNFFYVHFASFNPNLKIGQSISAGTFIGVEGWTGNVRPPGPGGRHTHVHVATAGGVREYPITALSRL